MSKDLYGILNINKNATEQELKKAYKKAALKHHPDRNQGNKEEAETKVLLFLSSIICADIFREDLCTDSLNLFVLTFISFLLIL